MPGPLVVIYTAHGQLEVQMVKMRLDSEGIPNEAVQESYGMTLGLTFGRLGQADILVPVEYKQQAREVLGTMEKDIEEDESQ